MVPPCQPKEEIIMANKVSSFSNKYSDHQSIDGRPLNVGEVLVPYWFQSGSSIPSECKERTTTWTLGEFKFLIGFMPIPESDYASYMKEFNQQLNDYMNLRREGRCIIGKNPDGTDKLCPNSRHCKGCPEKGTHERYNPHRVKLLSLDFLYEDESFDYADETQPSVEEQVLDALCPNPSDEEICIRLFDHLDSLNPQYSKIIKLTIEKKSVDEICVEINLKHSRGREVINGALDAVCDYFQHPHYRKNHKK